jgi:hypothetical protein
MGRKRREKGRGVGLREMSLGMRRWNGKRGQIELTEVSIPWSELEGRASMER